MRLSGNLKRAVFLDRDGVVNKAIIKDNLPQSPKKLSELEIIQGVRLSIELLKMKGFEIVVITNQPDIARGLITINEIESFHKKIESETGITNFYVCPHDEIDTCKCRKPKIGLIQNASIKLGIDLSTSYVVGDRWKDIEAGQTAGCQCFFIDYKYSEKQPMQPFIGVASLMEAAITILEGENE